jgi:hypothetical protein
VTCVSCVEPLSATPTVAVTGRSTGIVWMRKVAVFVPGWSVTEGWTAWAAVPTVKLVATLAADTGWLKDIEAVTV